MEAAQVQLATTTQEELPLLDLFTRLREAGLPLGIDEYRLILEALQKGFGTTNQEALAELCRTLWVKSKDEEHLFNYHFQQVISAFAPAPTSPEKADSYDIKNTKSSSQPKLEQVENTPASVTVSSELIEVEDEMQVAEAVQINTNSN